MRRYRLSVTIQEIDKDGNSIGSQVTAHKVVDELSEKENVKHGRLAHLGQEASKLIQDLAQDTNLSGIW